VLTSHWARFQEPEPKIQAAQLLENVRRERPEHRQKATKYLVDCLNNDDLRVSGAAVDLMGKSEVPGTMTHLARLLRGKHPWVNTETSAANAAHALALSGNPRAVRSLLDGLNHPQVFVRQVCDDKLKVLQRNLPVGSEKKALGLLLDSVQNPLEFEPAYLVRAYKATRAGLFRTREEMVPLVEALSRDRRFRRGGFLRRRD
jgi:hypothetical protein